MTDAPSKLHTKGRGRSFSLAEGQQTGASIKESVPPILASAVSRTIALFEFSIDLQLTYTSEDLLGFQKVNKNPLWLTPISVLA